MYKELYQATEMFGPVAQLGAEAVQKAVPFPLYSVGFVRIAFLDKIVNIWAISSVGRALRSHRRGREFESLIVHQLLKTVHFCTVFCSI